MTHTAQDMSAPEMLHRLTGQIAETSEAVADSASSLVATAVGKGRAAGKVPLAALAGLSVLLLGVGVWKRLR